MSSTNANYLNIKIVGFKHIPRGYQFFFVLHIDDAGTPFLVPGNDVFKLIIVGACRSVPGEMLGGNTRSYFSAMFTQFMGCSGSSFLSRSRKFKVHVNI